MLTAAKLESFAKGAGADLLGISGIDRFAGVPAEHHPSSIFPEARSVIVVGKRITRGSLRGVEEGTQFDLYGQYGRNWLNNRILALITFRVAEHIEDNGWEAVPLQALPPETPAMGIAVRPHRPPPNVTIDVEEAAVRAGLAEPGYAGFLLTPEFGPRQRFQMILTDAGLEAHALLAQPVCDRDRHSHAAFCPLGAIDTEREQTMTICGKTMAVAHIDYDKCARCRNGAAPNPYHPAGKPDRLAALCARNCLVYLEKHDRLKNKFRHPFRKRPPWGIVEETRWLDAR